MGIKHLIVGLGMVGTSFLRILVENGIFASDDFFCVDSCPEACLTFVSLGGKADHFTCITLKKDNYESILCGYDTDDFVFDFSCEVKNIDLLNYCLKHGLHYISTSDSNWNLDDSSWVSAHQHFSEYKKLAKKRDRNARTSIIEFGMNPGLVSSFTKKCLRKIVETDTGSYIVKKREKLMQMLNNGQYAAVARKIGLRHIVEVDHDDQVFDIEPNEDCVYSPWNPIGFYCESLSAPELIFGTWREFRQFDKVRDCDFLDYYVSLLKHGCDCKARAYSPQGDIQGSLMSHEEIFSLSTFFQKGRRKPTSFFIYKPCELAEKSVQNNRTADNPDWQILDKGSYLRGGESVGVILQGTKFMTAYYGNYLDSSLIDETATIRQVSASVYAAYQYILDHPNEGFLFPEEIAEDEVLEKAQKYLGEYIFVAGSSVYFICKF